MTRGGGLQEVELLDGDDDVPEQPVVPARSRRRLWWVPVGAAVVGLSLVGTQLVLDAREDAAAERLAAVPGVFPPLGDELVVVRTVPRDSAGTLWSGVEVGDGRTAGLVVGADGSQSFTATDQRTGETLWSTPLLGPHAQRAAAGEQAYGGGCQGDALRGTPSTVAVCVVTDGFSIYESDGTNEESVPATTTRVMVLDVHDGHVTAEWPAQGMVRLAVLDGLVVVGTGEPGAGRVVVGHDLRSGEERWRHEEPPGDDPQQYWGVLAAGGLVGLYDEDTLTVLSPTGTVLRDDLQVDSGYGGGFSTDPVTGLISLVTYADDGTELTTLLAPDADPAADVVLDGTLLNVAVDDRSLPELVLTYQSRTFGWDRTTGEALWEAEVQPNYGVLVIRGRVYLTTSTEVVALDGRTGEVVWRTPLPELGEGSLATDGRDLLLLSPKLGLGDDTGGVTFFDLGSGDVIRSLLYPEGVSDIQAMSGVLAAWSDGTEQVMIVE